MRNFGTSLASTAAASAAPAAPRVLVVGVDWLGDAIFMTPVFKALKKHWPGSYVALSTASRNVPAMERSPHLDEIVPYDEVPFLLGLGAQQRLFSRFARGRFDAALFLHRSFTRALAAARAGIPRRIGFSHPKRDWLLTERLSAPSAALHRIDAYLSVLKPMGLRIDDRTPELRPKPGDQAEWSALMAARTRWTVSDRILALHPGGNWDLKRWPVGSFAELARRATAAGWKIAVCGSAHEADLGKKIERSAPEGSVVSFAGQTSFGALVGLLGTARLMISNDSGPLHLAAALGTPVVGVFGPTLENLTGPVSRGPSRVLRKDFGCELPCYFARCVNRVCLDRLTVDEVLAAAENVAGETVGR